MRYKPFIRVAVLCFAIVTGSIIEGTEMAKTTAIREKLDDLVPSNTASAEAFGTVNYTQSKQPNINVDGITLPVGNPEFIKNVKEGLPLKFWLGRVDDQVWVNGYTLKPLSTWATNKKELPVSRYAELHEAYSSLEKISGRLYAAGSMGIDDIEKQFVAVEAVQNANEKAYIKASAAESGDREAICKQFGEMEEFRRQQKAIYGRQDDYWPEVYEKIYRNSRTALAVAKVGGQPFGSAVLIGENLALTCKHVVEDQRINDPTKDLIVWLDFEKVTKESGGDGELPRKEFPVVKVLLSGKKIPAGAEPLDFALVELGPATDGTRVHDKITPTALSSRLPARDDSIYIIGHPAGAPRTVHDNSFILFPFQVNESNFTRLKMYVCYETQNSPDRGKEFKEFLESYVRGEAGLYEQYSKKWRSQPVIAADCDTVHGDSGSGAWDRVTGRLIGILYLGEPDRPPKLPYVGGWRRHEAILPISLILKQINSEQPNLLKQHNVQVK